eukprot:368567-Hanusia_phi.AAC.1
MVSDAVAQFLKESLQRMGNQPGNHRDDVSDVRSQQSGAQPLLLISYLLAPCLLLSPALHSPCPVDFKNTNKNFLVPLSSPVRVVTTTPLNMLTIMYKYGFRKYSEIFLVSLYFEMTPQLSWNHCQQLSLSQSPLKSLRLCLTLTTVASR